MAPPCRRALRTTGTSAHPDFLAGIILALAKLPEPQATSFLHWPPPHIPQQHSPFLGPQAQHFPAPLASYLVPRRSAPNFPAFPGPTAGSPRWGELSTTQSILGSRAQSTQWHPPHTGSDSSGGSPQETWHGRQASPHQPALPGQRPHAGPQHPTAFTAEPTLPSEATGISMAGKFTLYPRI